MASHHTIVLFALASFFALVTPGHQTVGAKIALTPEQRHQVLELRIIIEDALKTVNASDTRGLALDREIIEVKKGWNSTEVIFVHWWYSKPIIMSVVFAVFMIIALMVILLFYWSHLFVPLKPKNQENEQNSMEVNTSSSELTHKELQLVCSEPFGTIRYLLKYNPQDEQLMVTVSSCSNLPKNNGTGLLDPYVLTRLVFEKPGSKSLEPNDEALAFHSEHVKNSVNPVFNFSRTFRVDREKLTRTKVLFEIYDWNNGNKHTMVARHKHAIQDTAAGHEIDDILSTDFADFESRLKRGRQVPDTGPGDICVLLERGLQKEPLRVTVIECKGVYLRDSEGKVDEQTIPNVYVSVKLIEPHGRVHVRRTKIVRRCRYPYYNEEFCFDVAPDKLYPCMLRLSLIHVSDILRIKQTIGTLELSAEEEDNKLAMYHWLAIAPNPTKERNSRWVLQQSRIAKCSWHYLVTPEELAKLRASRDLNKQKQKQKQKLLENSSEEDLKVKRHD